MIPVRIEKISLNEGKRSYSVVLTSLDGPGYFIVEVGVKSAQAIAELSGQFKSDSFQTYKLLTKMINGLGGKVMCLKISETKEENDVISIVEILDNKDKRLQIKCMPGDGIILAMIYKTPILIDEESLRIPEAADTRRTLIISRDDLEQQLEKAVEEEDYELAASLRDQLKDKFS